MSTSTFAAPSFVTSGNSEFPFADTKTCVAKELGTFVNSTSASTTEKEGQLLSILFQTETKPENKKEKEKEKVDKKKSGDEKDIQSKKRIHQVGKFWAIESMHDKPLNRLQHIHHWYTNDRIETLLLPLIEQNDRLSLRALDWLVTNYSKKFNVVLAHQTNYGPPVNIWRDYQAMLTFWRRKNFDPFRRHQRIYFMWKSELQETTVGQLNFLHWAENCGVIRYAKDHIIDIENDMAQCMSRVKVQKKQDKEKGTKRKRSELSKAPTRQCYIYPHNMRVKFDSN